MKPEEEAEIILWDWLKIKSKPNSVEEIYFNRKNKVNAPTFQTSGINKKPDVLIKFNRGFGNEYIAVEIKNALTSKSVLDAGKILDYYENYLLNKTKYLIDKREIKINHFVIATQNSIKGHLFKFEDKIISNCNNEDQWRKTNAKYHLEPQYEYNETSRFQRNLWNQFARLRKKYNIKECASVGIIISEINKEGITNNNPYLFIMNYNKHLKKRKWGSRWWKI